MGIPQFYRWIRDRYPCVTQVVRFHQFPDYDNLYIDMNGIIHVCTGYINEEHENPDDASVTPEVIEKKLFTYVCQYIEALFCYVKPQKLLFLAVDGVSPIAKLNNQRVALFTKEAVIEREKMLKCSQKFNANFIGCGTEFMERLHKHLQYFIIKQQSHDPAWQKVEVILSGHLVPGEGEHKMMDHIRYQRAQPGYDPNTRHCLYGLDADFILLGLVTHEPYITLVYEFFWIGQKRLSHIPNTFYLFQFSILREYIEADFSSLKGSLSFGYDLEAIIDDWVLIVCFLGNDFIPAIWAAIPDDKEDILSVLYKSYLQVLPSLGGYIQENGVLNLERYEKYTAALIEDKFDEETQEERQEYYMEIFTHLNVRDQDLLHKVVESYVTGVQWVLQYYYTGMPSWDWYYPYHYAPFMSDLKQFSGQPLKEFELGEPMFPLHQMLARLHPASSALLPEAYQCLVVNKDSPLMDIFPTDFDPDDNWGQIVFHSYVDKDKLLKAVEPYNEQLTAEEKERNQHSPCLSYTYDDQVAAGHTYCSPCPGSTMFPDIVNCKSNCKDLSITPFLLKKQDMVFGLCQGVSLDHYVPGFPTFQHIPHKIEFVNRCKSDREHKSATVQPQNQKVADFTSELVGKTCYVGWPYLVEAKVWGLSNGQHWYACEFPYRYGVRLKQQENHVWWNQVKNFTNKHWKELRIGVKRSEVKVVVEVQELVGRQYVHGPRGSLTVIKQWSHSSTYHPLQAIVRVEDITTHTSQHQEAISTLEQLFHNGDQCFLLVPDKYGEQAEVTSVDMLNEKVHFKLKKSPVEPNMEPVRKICNELKTDYAFALEEIAEKLKLTRKDIDRITGSLYCIQGSPDSGRESESENEVDTVAGDIGLKLKFYKNEIVGYSHWIGFQCFLSQDAKDLICEYKNRFPSVFEYFTTSHEQQKFYFETDLFPGDTGGLQACLNWLESLPTWNMVSVPRGTIGLNQSQISEVQSAVTYKDQEAKVKPPEQFEHFQTHPSNLFKPIDHQGGLIPDLKASYEVLDRVVNVSRSCSVPLGLRGTVIGVSIPSDKSDDHALIEILFDQEFPGGVSIRASRRSCYCLPMCCLINLSRGRILVERNRKAAMKYDHGRNQVGVLYEEIRQLEIDSHHHSESENDSHHNSESENNSYYHYSESDSNDHYSDDQYQDQDLEQDQCTDRQYRHLKKQRWYRHQDKDPDREQTKRSKRGRRTKLPWYE